MNFFFKPMFENVLNETNLFAKRNEKMKYSVVVCSNENEAMNSVTVYFLYP